MTDQDCPCGSGLAYAECCQPLIDSRQQAGTAEQLMRSRYAAFAVGAADHLWRTWHPSTRPAEVTLGDQVWLGLEIVDVVAGGPEDADGIVEFVARYRAGGTPGRLHERSRFRRRANRWFYLDAEPTP
ncbi:MAG: YchJ family metal-binding protein [Propionibacteriaceae bacterium]|nr:YchJ family metal-binding protein [Propionibacteriaceae bacterium]